MYKKQSIESVENSHNFVSTLKGSYKVKTNVWHPFGHYVLGGTDLTGEATRLSAPVHFDDDGSIANGCEPDILCNPRKSVFDVAEKTGVTEIQQAVQQLNSKTE